MEMESKLRDKYKRGYDITVYRGSRLHTNYCMYITGTDATSFERVMGYIKEHEKDIAEVEELDAEGLNMTVYVNSRNKAKEGDKEVAILIKDGEDEDYFLAGFGFQEKDSIGKLENIY